ncbi:uncharacterized protein PHALS_06684 [Plasmopara halstedii]|uniref:Uncharacterized protein n=1 Tax=Plasmopara halstedii TaxID=4781 RepID=A0A0P1B459_PLAHL|nr:uncharacterized protein PHALS_06684 [Plasmopara halstedii]CEG48889.1 hypothetical protein PHALS_06684 [Plasmopara halstedii]|eukprot:XP_024585258.1 hypothetical protein PHALS_06684 [Plasmopara halstedii]
MLRSDLLTQIWRDVVPWRRHRQVKPRLNHLKVLLLQRHQTRMNPGRDNAWWGLLDE